MQADRLAQIIAGAAVPQPDTGEVEQRAAELRQVDARRQQAADDLSALDGHVRTLQASATAIGRQLTACDASFHRGLADAVLEAYKRNAIAFVEANVPYLHSTIAALKAVTGSGPEWEGRFFLPNSLSLRWKDNEISRETPLHPPEHAMVHVWPRADMRLISGRPAVSGSFVQDLIAQITDGVAALKPVQ